MTVVEPVLRAKLPLSPERVHELLTPSSVAVIGASESSAWTSVMADNLAMWDFGGEVAFVNPRRAEVLGRRCFPSIGDVPHPVDHALIVVRNTLVPQMVEECAAAGTRNITIIPAGFTEGGPEGVALADEVRRLCAEHDVAAIGPNTAGWINTAARAMLVNIRLAHEPRPGPVAFACQSGGLNNAAYLAASAKGVGVRFSVGTGNGLIADTNDLFDYYLQHDEVRVLGGTAEQIPDPARFADICRRAADAGKPVVLLKLGRSAAAQSRTIAHTGSVAGADAVVDTFLRDLGVIRVGSMGELAETAKVLSRGVPRGRRLVFVGGSGGAGALCADEAHGSRLELVEMSDGLRQRIADAVPLPVGDVLNPVDTTIEGLPRFVDVVRLVAESGEADIVLMEGEEPVLPHGYDPEAPVRTWPSMDERTELQRVLSEHGVYAGLLGSSGRDPSAYGIRHSPDHHPVQVHGADGVRAVDHAVGYRAFLDARGSAELPASGVDPVDAEAVLLRGATTLAESDAKDLLRLYGIRVPEEATATSAEEAVVHAERIGFPVVLKVVSADVPHKSDVGGVVLGVADADGVRAAYASILASVAAAHPGAQVDGVLVAETVSGELELIAGITSDPAIGPAVVVGLGGVYVEVLRDTAMATAPVDRAAARRMLEGLRSYPLLAGTRGRAALDVDAVVDVLVRLGRLADDLRGRVAEVDLNPVIVGASGAVAADALVVLADRA